MNVTQHVEQVLIQITGFVCDFSAASNIKQKKVSPEWFLVSSQMQASLHPYPRPQTPPRSHRTTDCKQTARFSFLSPFHALLNKLCIFIFLPTYPQSPLVSATMNLMPREWHSSPKRFCSSSEESVRTTTWEIKVRKNWSVTWMI